MKVATLVSYLHWASFKTQQNQIFPLGLVNKKKKKTTQTKRFLGKTFLDFLYSVTVLKKKITRTSKIYIE